MKNTEWNNFCVRMSYLKFGKAQYSPIEVMLVEVLHYCISIVVSYGIKGMASTLRRVSN